MNESNILFLSDGIFPFSVGGMQQHTAKLVKAFLSQEVNVHLFHTVLGGTQPAVEVVNELFSNNSRLSVDYVTFPSSIKLPGHYVRNSKAYSEQVYEKIGQNISKYDLIYAQGFTGYAFLNNSFGIPLISNLHGLEMFQRSADVKSRLKNKMLQPIAKKILRNSDINISLGGKLSGIIEQQSGRSDNIWEVPNFIDSAWLNKLNEHKCTNGMKKILFIGRYERRKGIEELYQVISRFSSIEFHFVGDLPKLNTENSIYHGKVTDQEKLISIIDDCDALICPSYSEGMPTVILEAMARGLAIIATNVGAVSSLVDQKNGWLIANADTNNIESALNEFLSTDSLKEMQKNSTKRAGRFTTKIVVEQFLMKINEYLSQHKI